MPSATTSRAREMRKSPTAHEQALWSRLRKRRCGGFKFRRQHPMLGYYADFYCPERKLVVEVDGRSHVGREDHDRRRDQAMRASGCSVLRFLTEEVEHDLDAVVASILAFLRATKQGAA